MYIKIKKSIVTSNYLSSFYPIHFYSYSSNYSDYYFYLSKYFYKYFYFCTIFGYLYLFSFIYNTIDKKANKASKSPDILKTKSFHSSFRGKTKLEIRV